MTRGRAPNLSLPPSRQLTNQREYRARKAAHVAGLEDKIKMLEARVEELEEELRKERELSTRLMVEGKEGGQGKEGLAEGKGGTASPGTWVGFEELATLRASLQASLQIVEQSCNPVLLGTLLNTAATKNLALRPTSNTSSPTLRTDAGNAPFASSSARASGSGRPSSSTSFGSSSGSVKGKEGERRISVQEQQQEQAKAGRCGSGGGHCGPSEGGGGGCGSRSIPQGGDVKMGGGVDQGILCGSRGELVPGGQMQTDNKTDEDCCEGLFDCSSFPSENDPVPSSSQHEPPFPRPPSSQSQFSNHQQSNIYPPLPPSIPPPPAPESSHLSQPEYFFSAQARQDRQQPFPFLPRSFSDYTSGPLSEQQQHQPLSLAASISRLRQPSVSSAPSASSSSSSQRPQRSHSQQPFFHPYDLAQHRNQHHLNPNSAATSSSHHLSAVAASLSSDPLPSLHVLANDNSQSRLPHFLQNQNQQPLQPSQQSNISPSFPFPPTHQPISSHNPSSTIPNPSSLMTYSLRQPTYHPLIGPVPKQSPTDPSTPSSASSNPSHLAPLIEGPNTGVGGVSSERATACCDEDTARRGGCALVGGDWYRLEGV